MAVSANKSEVQKAARFEFGDNWRHFLRSVDEEVIEQAQRSLGGMLKLDVIPGKTFLDAGSGSGLFSLAACQLGFRVHSFDVDVESCRCTEALRRRFLAEEKQHEWTIEQGSLLDPIFVQKLGQFDDG